MAMQGLGKPGVNIGCLQQGAPVDTRFYFPGYSEGGLAGDLAGTAMAANLFQKMPQLSTTNSVQQAVPRLKIPEAIMDGECEGYPADPQHYRGTVLQIPLSFARPLAGEALLQIWRLALRHHDRHQSLCDDMYRTDKLECVVNQSIWLEGEAKFADIILPACTNFERWDISEFANCGGYIQHSSRSAITA